MANINKNKRQEGSCRLFLWRQDSILTGSVQVVDIFYQKYLATFSSPVPERIQKAPMLNASGLIVF
jgi:hypothetical protein